MSPPLIGEIFSIDLFGDRAHDGPGAAFIVLVSFLVAFLCIRTSARMTRSVSWWPGGLETDGGVHLHHLVWGICLMAIGGFLGISTDLQAPWWHLVCIAFGVGVGFTLDEFALWVRLDDVYWKEEGRASFDAVVCATVFAGLVVLGTRPFGLDETGSVLGTTAAVVVVLGLAVVSFAKGRVTLGTFGLFVPLFGLFGALRLAHPASPWANWRYDDKKLGEARARFAPDRPMSRLQRKLGNMIAGAPSIGDD